MLKEKGWVYACSKPRTGEVDVNGGMNWHFRVPQSEAISFTDHRSGPHKFITEKDFDDFVVWRKEGVASYELAIVVDYFIMGITEVVRGEDLLLSTARQLLIYRALNWAPPVFITVL